jgi:hypothetical protein
LVKENVSTYGKIYPELRIGANQEPIYLLYL